MKKSEVSLAIAQRLEPESTLPKHGFHLMLTSPLQFWREAHRAGTAGRVWVPFEPFHEDRAALRLLEWLRREQHDGNSHGLDELVFVLRSSTWDTKMCITLSVCDILGISYGQYYTLEEG